MQTQALQLCVTNKTFDRAAVFKTAKSSVHNKAATFSLFKLIKQKSSSLSTWTHPLSARTKAQTKEKHRSKATPVLLMQA